MLRVPIYGKAKQSAEKAKHSPLYNIHVNILYGLAITNLSLIWGGGTFSFPSLLHTTYHCVCQ